MRVPHDAELLHVAPKYRRHTPSDAVFFGMLLEQRHGEAAQLTQIIA